MKSFLRKLDPRWKDVPSSLKGRPRKRVFSIAYATGGMLAKGNVDALHHGLKETKNVEGSMLEIGSFCGLSSNVITYLKRHLDIQKPLFAMDPWDLVEIENPEDDLPQIELGIPRSELGRFIRESYVARVGFFSRDDLPHALHGFSGNLMEEWHRSATVTDLFGREVTLGGPISFAFIDGDHSYEGARLDYENIDRHLSVGGMILFDDSADAGQRGCEAAAREAAAQKNYKLISKNPNYLVQKIGP